MDGESAIEENMKEKETENKESDGDNNIDKCIEDEETETREGHITFEDLGIEETAAVTDTCLGTFRRPSDLTALEIIYLVVALAEGNAILGLTVNEVIVVRKSTASFTIGIVIIVNIVFCMYFVVSGVFVERVYELCVYVLGILLILIYMAVQYAIGNQNANKMGRLIMVAVLSPFLIAKGVYLVRRYYIADNLVFRTVGANVKFQGICKTLFIFLTLIKLTLVIMILTKGSQLDTEDKIVLPMVGVVSLGPALMGYLSARWENKKLIVAYVASWILIPAYCFYMFVVSGRTLAIDPKLTNPQTALYVATFVCAALLLAIRHVLLVFAVRVAKNFGKGLKQKVFKLDMETAEPSENIDEETVPMSVQTSSRE